MNDPAEKTETQMVVDGYSAAAAELIGRYETLTTEEVLGPVLDLLPDRRGRALDIGAGTGRDAAWLARKGHDVVAVEPVREFLDAGRTIHSAQNIMWVDDQLPTLAKVRLAGQQYDLILLVGVWHHLTSEQQNLAPTVLADLCARRGRLLVSLRHGPGQLNRPGFPVSKDQLVCSANVVGLQLLASRAASSIQPENIRAGVTWTWLCFERM